MGVDEFARYKFGTVDCPPGHEDIWQLAYTEQFVRSPLFAIRNFFYIADKNQQLVHMDPFSGQALLDVILEAQRRAGLPGRVCSIKFRQMGNTLYCIARCLHYCLDENKRGFILVDDENVAREQATRLGTMLNGLPRWLQPHRRIQNLTHIVFENPNAKERLEDPGLNSAIQTTVPASFRGVAPGFVVIGEYAHMAEDRQEAVQTGIISASALNPNYVVVIDTTPNGFDGFYEPLASEAVEMNPKWMRRIETWKGEISAAQVLDGVLGIPDVVLKGRAGAFVPHFWPWRLHEEYSCRSKFTPRGELPRLTAAQRAETESTLGKMAQYGDDEEKEYKERWDVSTERLFWRRCKIDSYGFPTKEMKLLTFRQEFGNSVESMFIDSGSAPFDRDSIDAWQRQVREPAVVGLMRGIDEFDHHAGNEYQQVRLYAPPRNGFRYVMGVDTDIAYESPDSDATVGMILRWPDFKICAAYEARVPSFFVRQQLYWLYRWYFDCYYAIETAGMGYDLVRSCIDMGMHNVHYWKRYDMAFPEESRFPGWQTDQRSRPLMDQTFTELACHRDPNSGKPDPLLTICDEKTLKEIRGLTRQPTGAFKSSRGHDDHYDALCIALCIARDPYSGLVVTREAEKRQARAEFESWFRGGGPRSDRSHPDLANI